jgi:hypothetical protein
VPGSSASVLVFPEIKLRDVILSSIIDLRQVAFPKGTKSGNERKHLTSVAAYTVGLFAVRSASSR